MTCWIKCTDISNVHDNNLFVVFQMNAIHELQEVIIHIVQDTRNAVAEVEIPVECVNLSDFQCTNHSCTSFYCITNILYYLILVNGFIVKLYLPFEVIRSPMVLILRAECKLKVTSVSYKKSLRSDTFC